MQANESAGKRNRHTEQQQQKQKQQKYGGQSTLEQHSDEIPKATHFPFHNTISCGETS